MFHIIIVIIIAIIIIIIINELLYTQYSSSNSAFRSHWKFDTVSYNL